MRRLLLAILVVAGSASAAQARCQGQDMIATLPTQELAELRAAADAVPFALGNAWRATRDGREVYILGTLHLDDPRHEFTLKAVSPILERAELLLVEAGPDEERQLRERLAMDSSLLISESGPTLREVLSPSEWDILEAAMSARGVPAFVASKLQPWYVSMLLALPPCAITEGIPNGLDQRLMAAAKGAGIPVLGLEPYETAFKVFLDTPMDMQIRMLVGGLAAEAHSEDLSTTTINSYFAEDTRLSWEFTKALTATLPGYDAASAAAEYKLIEDTLMVARNELWVPLIEAKSAITSGPILVAVGALHLAGERGVLKLLQDQGFALERVAFQ